MQPNDPNKTLLGGGPIDPNRTQAMIGFDPLKTQAMGAISGPDPMRTQALSAVASGPAVQVNITPSREATLANGPAREQFLVEISGGMGSTLPGAHIQGSRTPLNLCLVIDRSGSMEGAPLEYVKQACAHVVDILTPNDILSIVTFEDTVDVLMPPQRVTNKAAIQDGIRRIVAGNTTNLYDGLSLGLQQVASLQDPNRATRMIVLTDGEPTAGIKDFSALVEHAGGIKERGISATFLGFGLDYNEELLHAMAKRAGGNYHYIPRPENIPDVFKVELEKLMTSVARNMTLSTKPSRWVTQLAPIMDGGAPLNLADLERGSTISQVIDLEFTNHPLGWYRVLTATLEYDDLSTGQHEKLDIDIVMEFTSDSARYTAPVNPKVAGAAQLARASKVVEKTVMGMKTGILSPMAAIAELQKTQALLISEGKTAEAREVTMALQAIQSGDRGVAEKTLMGTMLQLDQGKSST